MQEYLVKGEITAAALARNIRHAVERKRGELALQRSLRENNHLVAAIANVTVGVIIADAQTGDLPIVFANPAFSTITGYSREETIGRNYRFLQGPQTDKGALDQIRTTLRQHQAFHGELLNYRKDGTAFWNELSISPVFDEGTSLTHFVGVMNDVSGRRQAEDARRESEARFRTLTDALPQLIWANEADGTATYFNRRWFEYSGLSLEQSVGPGWQAIVHPDDAPTSVERWQQVLAAGNTSDAEYRLRQADGTYRWHLGRNVPLKDAAGRVQGWFGSATDIHDLKEAKAAIAAAEERLRLIVDSAQEHAIISMDRERRVTNWNTGAEGITGYLAAEMIGQSGDIIFLPEERAEGIPNQEMQRALAKGREGDNRWHLRKDGSLFWANGAMMPMQARPDGEVIGFVKVLRDETEVQQVKQALEQSREELLAALRETERARTEAEAANQAKDHFLAILSHELRTPLTPVLMATHTLAQRATLSPAVADALAMIRRNVELEARLIDDSARPHAPLARQDGPDIRPHGPPRRHPTCRGGDAARYPGEGTATRTEPRSARALPRR